MEAWKAEIMPQSYLRFAIAYVGLVALPLAGLLLVLRAGQSLTAPASVSGSWQMVRDSDQSSWFDCNALPSHTARLSISQSGEYLLLTLRQNATLSGRGTLGPSGLHATLTSTDTSCGVSPNIALQAIFDSGAKPMLFSGTLISGRCPACTSVPFHGLRQTLDQEDIH